jgi:hypothetical protein
VTLLARAYELSDADRWDAFVARTLQGTLLHTRRFLAYHDDRFFDRSLMLEEDGIVVGLFPAALSPLDERHVISHPGATYGGIVHQGRLRGGRMIAAIDCLGRYYRSIGLSRLTYKVVPRFYHRAPAEDDLYALFRLGATRQRCDLSCAVDLASRLPISERRRRGFKRASNAGVQVISDMALLPEFWTVLTENLARSHGVRPVHAIDEMSRLADLFPQHIRCLCGRLGDEVVAGVLLFITETAHHAQYIASSEVGHRLSALDVVLETAISIAEREGKRWFDFGISNESQGKFLNEGLFQFKSEFGAGGAVHEFYEWDLPGLND